jgi:hypothetical protein
MNPIHRGTIKQGKLLFDNPGKYFVQVSKLEGKRFELVLRVEKKQRSLPENSYYWGVVLEILSDNGNTPDEWHEICRYMFLKSFKTIGGKELEYIKSTTELSTIEFEEYLEKIRRWAMAVFNYHIPLPNEVEGIAENYGR